jgi:hypothetical protein
MKTCYVHDRPEIVRTGKRKVYGKWHSICRKVISWADYSGLIRSPVVASHGHQPPASSYFDVASMQLGGVELIVACAAGFEKDNFCTPKLVDSGHIREGT